MRPGPSLLAILVVSASCGGRDAPVAVDAPEVDAAPAVARVVSAAHVPPPAPPPPPPPPAPVRRWIAGDLHMHTAPPGARNDVEMTLPQIAAAARDHGLEFVLITPHLWQSTWESARRRPRWQQEWGVMAARARALQGVTMIPGTEYGLDSIGHFGVYGVALDTLDGADFLAAAHTAGAFIVVNHPFAVPVPGSPHEYSYRPWTNPKKALHVDPIDGVEVWNVMLRSFRILSARNEARGFVAADRLVHERRRVIALVGGTDNHRKKVIPTTWVLANDASEPTILAGLRAGATCVGGLEGSSLEAHGDADPPERWSPIGDSARATARLELRWKGRARLFVDGVDRGVHVDGWIDEAAGGLHTYRLEAGKSRCGFVYANLDPE